MDTRFEHDAAGRGDPPVSMGSLAAAMLVAFDLADHFRRGHGVAALDADDWLLGLTMCAAPDHELDDAVAWACAHAEPGRTRKVVLFSVRPDALPVREQDLRTFERARVDLSSCGLELVDWLQCDGTNVRSMAITTGASFWKEVEPAE